MVRDRGRGRGELLRLALHPRRREHLRPAERSADGVDRGARGGQDPGDRRRMAPREPEPHDQEGDETGIQRDPGNVVRLQPAAHGEDRGTECDHGERDGEVDGGDGDRPGGCPCP